MKKAIAFLLALALLCPELLTACSGSDTVTINVYNWGEYIDDEVMDVNEAFYEKTGIKVNYKTFDTNESMYTLISSGAADYDVVFPSDYMVGKMIKEGCWRSWISTTSPTINTSVTSTRTWPTTRRTSTPSPIPGAPWVSFITRNTWILRTWRNRAGISCGTRNTRARS